MAKAFHLEIITPSKTFYRGQAELVIVPTPEGEEGFMADHAWVCALLDVGELWIREPGKKEFKAAFIAGGFIDVKGGIVIFTDAAEWREEIDLDAKQLYVHAYLKEHRRINFRALLEKQNSRQEIIVTFMVLLEMISNGQALVEQEGTFGEITISYKDGTEKPQTAQTTGES